MSEEEEQKRRRFIRLWDTYFVRTRHYAFYRYYHERDLAEDAACVAFGKLWVGLDMDKISVGSEYAWLRVVVENDYFQWLRHKKKYPLDPLPTGGKEEYGKEIAASGIASDPVKTVQKSATFQALYECIEALPEHHRRVIIATLRENKVRQTAEELGIPENTVIGRRFVARRKLARCLAEKGALGNEQ